MIAIARPAKPTPDFPLFPHAKGKWAKKIGGRTVYFGKWEDPDGALEAYRRYQNTTPRVTDRLTVEDACNGFLASKSKAVDRSELSPVSFKEYHRTGRGVADSLGRSTAVESLTPRHFSKLKEEIAAKRNVVGLGNEIVRVRSIFKWCYEMGMISKPVQFGPEFKKPSAKVLRRHKRLAGKKMFTPEQIRLVIGECGYHLQSMIYLAINCGFGTNDCASLPLDAVDLETGWLHYPRPKTEIERDCPLWPETVQALAVSLANRHEPQPGVEGNFFTMPGGRSWEHNQVIAKYFRQALHRCEIRNGTFYWLRHTFATVAGGSKDQVAVGALMGHADASMAAVYREEIGEERLTAVTDHVRAWLQPFSLTECQRF